MSDYEHRDLGAKIDNLSRRIDDLDYDLRRAVDDLRAELRDKSDRYHGHED